MSAGKQLAYTAVRAPFAGVISARDVSAGDVVQPGGMLFSVVDPSVLQLQAAVPAEQLGVGAGRAAGDVFTQWLWRPAVRGDGDAHQSRRGPEHAASAAVYHHSESQQLTRRRAVRERACGDRQRARAAGAGGGDRRAEPPARGGAAGEGACRAGGRDPGAARQPDQSGADHGRRERRGHAAASDPRRRSAPGRACA